MPSKRQSAGFTLVELIISLAIIGLIVSLSFISYRTVRERIRDTERLNDIKQIQAALAFYYRDEGQYPATLDFGGTLLGLTSSTTYLALVPTAPSKSGNCTVAENNYSYSLKDGDYNLSFCLGGATGTYGGGNLCAMPSGIQNRACFICGVDQVVVGSLNGHLCNEGAPNYDRCTYDTVLIGEQCWLKQNSNIGAMVSVSTTQTDNETMEKYCYSSNYSNCQNYGALYQWNEAMQYSTAEEAQGVCPSGWHIPSDAEQDVLDQYLNDTTCDANRIGRGCDNAGADMLIGGNSGFECPLAGHRDVSSYFTNQDATAVLWSSTISGSDAWYRELEASEYGTYRDPDPQGYGFSVRCLKD